MFGGLIASLAIPQTLLQWSAGVRIKEERETGRG